MLGKILDYFLIIQNFQKFQKKKSDFQELKDGVTPEQSAGSPSPGICPEPNRIVKAGAIEKYC